MVMKIMDGKFKLKGHLKHLTRWPLYLTALLIILNIVVYAIDIKAGVVVTLGALIYLACAVGIFCYHRPQMFNDLVAFASQYEFLEKRVLEELALPYAIMDMQGRMIWCNKVFAQLTGKDQFYRKNINTIFPDITPDKLPVPEEKEISEISTQVGDCIYRISMQRVLLGEAMVHSEVLEGLSENTSLIAMYLYDETELKDYIKANEDNKLVVALAYLDNYEEALESVEDVRRSLLIALIDRKITKYFSNYDGLVRKLEKDKYFLIMRQSSLEALKEQILSGTIKPGQKLPSENELTREYALSRHTVRKALALLENEGYITAQHGKGTFCSERVIQRHNSKNIAVTGYDNSLIGQSSPIGITTIAHPQEKLGEMAAELILEKIRKVPEEESSVKRLISPELIVRESTAGKNLSTETKK